MPPSSNILKELVTLWELYKDSDGSWECQLPLLCVCVHVFNKYLFLYSLETLLCQAVLGGRGVMVNKANIVSISLEIAFQLRETDKKHTNNKQYNFR